MKLRKSSRWKFGFVLGLGAVVALVLCVQCVRTYLYTDAVLVPRQAEREAGRQMGVVTIAARSAGVSDPRKLGPVLEHAMESASDRVLWMRVLDLDGKVLAQGGSPQQKVTVPSRWRERLEKHEDVGSFVDTPQGKAFVTMLPIRLQRPARVLEAGVAPPDHHFRPGDKSRESPVGSPDLHGRPSGDPHAGYALELAISLKAVSGTFEGLRQNQIIGVIASIALLLSLAIIGLHAPHYLRGKYLEGELRLARRVQSDLQPKQHSVLPHVQFAATAVAADHVGGDFHDIFDAGSDKIAIVLGDVSGKGVPAALLVSVLQGAIRSSTASEHEHACERINRMLCERTACERFATLFWGVFDPRTSTLRYVNAGHAAPMLMRQGGDIERLNDGGPVLGLLPTACYSAGVIEIKNCDLLILYSDGINEAANEHGEELGEDRMMELIPRTGDATPSAVCERIMNQVMAFAGGGVPSDDRTLMVVGFPQAGAVQHFRKAGKFEVEAVA